MPNYELGNIYEYDGSIASLYAGALLDTNLLNFGSGPGSATISDDDGTLDTTDTGVTQIYFDSFLQDSITYLGAGDIYTIGVLGLRVDPRPVAAFEFNGQVYLYAPEGLPLLSAVSFGVDIDVNATIELPPNSLVPDGVVNGLNLACRIVGSATDGVFIPSVVYPPFRDAPPLNDRVLRPVPMIQAGMRRIMDLHWYWKM